MEGGPPDTTQDWLLPAAGTPPTVAELERRVEEAVAIARASEQAVMTVGAAALDAARQARRAAELAERASAMALAGSAATEGNGAPGQARGPGEAPGRSAAPSPSATSHPTSAAPGQDFSPAASGPDQGLGDFMARADRLAARLAAISLPGQSKIPTG